MCRSRPRAISAQPARGVKSSRPNNCAAADRALPTPGLRSAASGAGARKFPTSAAHSSATRCLQIDSGRLGCDAVRIFVCRTFRRYTAPTEGREPGVAGRQYDRIVRHLIPSSGGCVPRRANGPRECPVESPIRSVTAGSSSIDHSCRSIEKV